MSFRARLTLVAAAAVAAAVVAASFAVYFIVRNDLRGTVDNGLRATAEQIEHLPPHELGRVVTPPPEVGGTGGYVQIVLPNGSTYRPPPEAVTLPVGKRERAIAKTGRGSFFRDMHVAGNDLRVLTVPYAAPGYAIQVARSLDEVNHVLGRLVIFLLAIDLCGVAIAAALGLLISRAALAPVRRLSDATEKVAATGDLSERIDARGTDELSRLAGRFNTMLGALEESRRAQRQLVADAVERARRNRPGVLFITDLEETVVHGVPATIERAVANLLDNAAKWSPPSGTVEISVREGRVTVRDHGPGIDEEDLPYVFDRFYRASTARGLPGSGLGLAIVRQVAEAHGGRVLAERAEGGGTRMTLQLS